MTVLAILLGIAFVIATFVALSYRDECVQLRAHKVAAADLYDQCLKLEYYNNYLEARVSMTNQIHAGGMMYARCINVNEKMIAREEGV